MQLNELVEVLARLGSSMRIPEVEVVASGDDVLDRYAPCVLGLLAIGPPCLLRLELTEAHRLRLRVALVSHRILVLVIPNGLCRVTLSKEQNVCLDGGVRRKDAGGQSNDRVQVALGEK